ncbi:MAG: proline/glycine betaine ABC transporter permease [Spirochaetaceae bacterium]|nr:MAG: proline/glycine betaine ABC transporter permease [Spirochaetaceae bacterium]
MNDLIPQIPLAAWIDAALSFTTTLLSPLTRAVSGVLSTGIRGMVDGLVFIPPWLFVIIAAAAAWKIAGRKVAILAALGMLLIWNLGLWRPMISTLSLVLISTLIAVAIGLPLGIIAALNDRFFSFIRPILDFMQTLPAFVYLIPAIPFFGLGAVSAIMSTVIFSIPPAIRLTTLGIRQIDAELIEASDAFGSTTMQKLIKVQIPIATPTIMAGVNQTIMLSLSMVVIAAMIGAGGLGGEVWRAIQRLRAGAGFEAGIAVVILAMILDRITQKIGAGRQRSVVTGDADEKSDDNSETDAA